MQGRFHPERVPGAENAVIEDSKLLLYALNPDHPQGRGKALFFEAIGYTRADYEELRTGILALLPYLAGQFVRKNADDADNWEAVMAIRRLDVDGTANIATYWEVREGHPTRLISLYPTEAR